MPTWPSLRRASDQSVGPAPRLACTRGIRGATREEMGVADSWMRRGGGHWCPGEVRGMNMFGIPKAWQWSSQAQGCSRVCSFGAVFLLLCPSPAFLAWPGERLSEEGMLPGGDGPLPECTYLKSCDRLCLIMSSEQCS